MTLEYHMSSVFSSPVTTELSMAARTFGGSSVKISNLNLGFGRTEFVALQTFHAPRTRTLVRYPSLVISKRLRNASIGCRCSSEHKPVSNSGDDSEEAESSATSRQLFPSSDEVECLLNQICDTSSIGEFELKLGGFRLYVIRDLTGKSKPASPPTSAPADTNATIEVRDQHGYVSPPTLVSKLMSSGGVHSFVDRAVDEGFVILKAPRVGYFRRCRTIKGRSLPPLCEEGQMVKEGKVICFIEQFGGKLPVTCDTSGEVIKILREDGDPVGYGDPLIVILPSFPGIKMLQ